MAESDSGSGGGSGEFWQGIDGDGRLARMGRVGVGAGMGVYQVMAEGVSGAAGMAGYVADLGSHLHLLPRGSGTSLHRFADRVDSDEQARSDAYHAEYDSKSGSWGHSVGYGGAFAGSMLMGGGEMKMLGLAGRALPMAGRMASRIASPLLREAPALAHAAPSVSRTGQGLFHAAAEAAKGTSMSTSGFVRGMMSKMGSFLPGRTVAREAEATAKAVAGRPGELVAEGAEGLEASAGRSLLSRVGGVAGRGAGKAGEAGLSMLGDVAMGALGSRNHGILGGLGRLGANAAMLIAAFELVKHLVEKYFIGDEAMKGTGPGMIDVARAGEAAKHPAIVGVPGIGPGVAGSGPAAPLKGTALGAVAGADVAIGDLSAQQRAAYGNDRIQPASSINFDQTARLTTHAGGQPREVVLPYLRGANDAETLQRSGQWWNTQADKGLVPPIREGDTMSVGRAGSKTERSYVVRDGRWVNGELASGRSSPGLVGNASVRTGEIMPGVGMRVSGAGLSRAVDMRGGMFGGPYGRDAVRALDDPSSGMQAFAGVDPLGNRSVTMATTDRGRGTIGSAVVASVSPKGDATIGAITSLAPSSGRSILAMASAPADGSVHLAKDGRLAMEPGSEAIGAKVRGAASLRDGLVDGVVGNRGIMQAGISRQLGDAPSAGVNFSGVDKNGFMMRGGMSVENGAATFKVLGEHGNDAVWSKSVRDPGFAVGPDGAVRMDGRAAEMAKGFLADPKGSAQRMEGRGRGSSMTADFLAMPMPDLDRIDAPGVPRAVPRIAREGIGR